MRRMLAFPGVHVVAMEPALQRMNVSKRDR